MTDEKCLIPPEGTNNLWYCCNDSDTVFIFVHGIFSSSNSAWLHENGTYWPELILKDARYQKPSVYLGGFYTSYVSGDTYDMRAAANELYSALSVPDASGRPCVLDKKNIVFITHSTGGIVVRHMLTRHAERFQEKKLGLVLIASPSMGSKDANRLSWLLAWANNRMGKELKWDNDFLRELDKDFKNLVDAREIPALIGLEMLESHFVKAKGAATLVGRDSIVTVESGGQYFGEPIVIGGSDHFSVVKPSKAAATSNTALINYYLNKFIATKALAYSLEQYEQQLLIREAELNKEHKSSLERADAETVKEREKRKAIENELAVLTEEKSNFEASYAKAIQQLEQAQATNKQLEGQVPTNQLEAAEAAIEQGPDAAYEAYNTIVETASEPIAKAAYQAAELAKIAIRYPEALRHYRKAAALDEKNPQYLDRLATMLQDTGTFSEAEPLYVESMVVRKKQLGDEHPDVATSLNNLAELYRALGRYSEAEPLYVESLAIRKKQLGVEHPDVATSLSNLAVLYRAQGHYSEAESLCLQSLSIRKKHLGDEHPDVATSLNNLGRLYEFQDHNSEAEPLYVEAIAILEKRVGAEHPNTRAAKTNYERLKAKMQEAQGT